MQTQTQPSVIEKVRLSLERLFNPNFIVKLYNDDNVAAELVTDALERVLDLTRSHAWSLMMQCHNKGEVVVFEGDKRKCEHIVNRLTQYGLTVDIIAQA